MSDVPPTADGVRERNRALDGQLIAFAVGLQAGDVAANDDGWSAMQVLAHMSEASRFFADQIRAWIDDRARVMGRTTAYEGRLAAVDRARVADMTADALLAELQASLNHLTATLDLLDDSHVTAMTRNVKYGDEAFAEFLERYVLGHKGGHITQLQDLTRHTL